jgi:uncharacterized protein (TIRG00374 family)
LLGELRAAADLFKSARWAWLAGLILVQILSYTFLTYLNLLSLRPFPGAIRPLRLMALLTSMAFIETAVPSAGASGLALRARLLGKHGQYSFAASAFSLGLEMIYVSIAVGSVGLFGLVYLISANRLPISGLFWLATLALVVAGLVWNAWRILRDPVSSRRVLSFFVRHWNCLTARFPRLRFLRRLDFAALERRLDSFQASLAGLQGIPQWQFWLSAYGKVFFDVAALGVCFLLYQHAIPVGTLLTGYGLILVLSGLASLPGGLGMADASVPVIFAGLGTPAPVALAAGLTYRLFAFWLLRFIGFISWQVLEARR